MIFPTYNIHLQKSQLLGKKKIELKKLMKFKYFQKIKYFLCTNTFKYFK